MIEWWSKILFEIVADVSLFIVANIIDILIYDSMSMLIYIPCVIFMSISHGY